MSAADQSATRRELIKRGVARARGGGDVGALRALAGAEQVLVTTYEQVLAAGILGPRASTRAGEFLAHERAHLAAIERQLVRLGGARPGPSGAVGAVSLPSDRAAVRLLLALERAALSAYYAELDNLRDGLAAQTAAEIMACDAQHATELRELLSPGDAMRAVPSSFVFGTP
jgi:rubrerythrin